MDIYNNNNSNYYNNNNLNIYIVPKNIKQTHRHTWIPQSNIFENMWTFRKDLKVGRLRIASRNSGGSRFHWRGPLAWSRNSFDFLRGRAPSILLPSILHYKYEILLIFWEAMHS